MRLAALRYDGPIGGGRPAANERARPLVIAHGLFGSARNWATLAKRFAETRPVVAVDLRNHGDSPWSMRRWTTPSLGADLLETIDAEA